MSQKFVGWMMCKPALENVLVTSVARTAKYFVYCLRDPDWMLTIDMCFNQVLSFLKAFFHID